MNFALVKNNIVVNTIVGEMSDISAIYPEMDHIVEIPQGVKAGVGYTYNPATDVFTEPTPVAQEEIKAITELEFRRRFTLAEKTAIYTAAESDLMIKIFLEDLRSSAGSTIYLDHPEIIQGVQYLEQQGIISTGRANEILGIQGE